MKLLIIQLKAKNKVTQSELFFLSNKPIYLVILRRETNCKYSNSLWEYLTLSNFLQIVFHSDPWLDISEPFSDEPFILIFTLI